MRSLLVAIVTMLILSTSAWADTMLIANGSVKVACPFCPDQTVSIFGSRGGMSGILVDEFLNSPVFPDIGLHDDFFVVTARDTVSTALDSSRVLGFLDGSLARGVARFDFTWIMPDHIVSPFTVEFPFTLTGHLETSSASVDLIGGGLVDISLGPVLFISPNGRYIHKFEGATFTITSTPEPSTWLLLSSGLVGLVIWRRYAHA